MRIVVDTNIFVLFASLIPNILQPVIALHLGPEHRACLHEPAADRGSTRVLAPQFILFFLRIFVVDIKVDVTSLTGYEHILGRQQMGNDPWAQRNRTSEGRQAARKELEDKKASKKAAKPGAPASKEPEPRHPTPKKFWEFAP